MRRAAAAVSGMLAIACVQDEGARLPPPLPPHVAVSNDLVVETVATYGWRELADSTRSLVDAERRAGGAVLGHIASIAESESGDVYVLDGQYHKIVRFDASGGLVQVILGGYGHGPAEFIRPRALTVDRQDRIWVQDDGRNRVVIFNAAGEFERSFRLPFADVSDLVIQAGRVFVARRTIVRGRMSVLEIESETGVPIDSAFALDERGVDLASFGASSGVIARKGDEELVYGHPSPGLSAEISVAGRVPLPSGEGEYRGAELFPDVRGFVEARPGAGEVRITPIASIGIGAWDLGTAMAYTVRTTGPEGPLRSAFVALFDEHMRYLGSVPLGGFGSGFRATNAQYEFLIGLYEPWPHVLRARIMEQERTVR